MSAEDESLEQQAERVGRLRREVRDVGHELARRASAETVSLGTQLARVTERVHAAIGWWSAAWRFVRRHRRAIAAAGGLIGATALALHAVRRSRRSVATGWWRSRRSLVW